jgi:UDP-hydrolysing UDP-N-acetyl-D-glucosamine 2-epimerase
MKKVCAVIGSRANYSSIKSVLSAINLHNDLELQLIVHASALLDKYGEVSSLIEADGFKIDRKIFNLIEGENLITMAKSTGLGLIELATAIEQLKPDYVITVGDRFETMATAIAATYLNICLVHTMGGEVSGNIDETIRHAITKLAHVHFPACSDAKQRILRMGEEKHRVFNVGCPRMDLVAEYLNIEYPAELDTLLQKGVGNAINIHDKFILVSQHPVTYEHDSGERQITNTLEAIAELDIPALVLWPNADAGSESVSRGIRKFRENRPDAKMYYLKNLPIHVYVWLMKKTVCLVGNSSSALREGAFIGTPAVNIGTRQSGRQHGENIIHSGYEKDEIKRAITECLEGGRPKREAIYGEGKAGESIARILAENSFEIEKKITY